MMHKVVARILIIMIFPFFLAGCKAIFLKSSYGNYYSRLAPERYDEEIDRLTKMTDEDSPSFRPIAYLHLSLLYSSYKNPERDYSKALEEMERYVLLDTFGSDRYEVQNILELLREINSTESGIEEDLEGIELSNEELRDKNAELVLKNTKLVNFLKGQKKEALEKEGTIEELNVTINDLNETIDKLKNLDMELEKKRKSFR